MTVLPQLRAEVVGAIESPRRRVVRVRSGPLVAFAAAAAVLAVVLLALPGSDERAATPPAEAFAAYGVLQRAQTGDDRNAIAYLRTRFTPEDLAGLQEDAVRRVGPHAVLFAAGGDSLCLDVPAGSGCWDAGELRSGKTLQSGGGIDGIVPDGVATVTVRLADGDHTAEAHDNVFSMTTRPAAGGHPQDIHGVTWRDAAGRPIGP